MADEESKTQPWAIRVQDPLTRVTRMERRNLLAASFIGVIIAKTGLVPSKVSALGIDFDHADQSALLKMFAIVVVYFLLAFLIYAASDMIAWRSAILAATVSLALQRAEQEEERARREGRPVDPYSYVDGRVLRRRNLWSALGRPMSVARALFEFLLPVVIGLYAVRALSTTPPPKPANAPTAITVPISKP